MDARVLETLRPLAALCSILGFGFLIYNAFDMPPGVREPVMALDCFTVVACGWIWWLVRKDRIPASWAHPVGTFICLLVMSNVLLSMLLLRDAMYILYVDIALVGVGAMMVSPRWAAFAAALTVGLSLPALWHVTADAVSFGRHLATVLAATGLGVAVLVARLQKERELSDYISRDQTQREALQVALEDAESARRDLDEKVAQRTDELVQANASLESQIDQRRSLETQLRHVQRLESMGQLAGGVAHDFNNLLSAIIVNLDVSLDELPEGFDQEPLEDARYAATRAIDVTRQLLAFSRKQEMEREKLDLAERLEHLNRILNRILGDDVRLHLELEVPSLWVNADPSQIEQVLLNLAVNARDAMPMGGLLTIRLMRERIDGEDYALVRVQDTGMGMEDAVREHAFEPFFTTKDPGKGTGLGLSTVYGIIHQHGGSIEVSSEPGEGTTFDVYLPIASSEGTRDAATDLVNALGGTETVLLVEDEEAVRRVGERILRRHGYEVLAASNGKDAIDIAKDLGRPIDLLWTDVIMPGMSGTELARRLRDLQPDLKVLFASGYTGDYLATHTGELPEGTTFMYKPYAIRQVAETIRTILDDP